MYVYQLNEDEFWMGRSLSVTIAAYQDMCGPDILDHYDEKPFQLSEQDMQIKTIMCDDGIRRTFAEELALRVADGCLMECPFAGTEW